MIRGLAATKEFVIRNRHAVQDLGFVAAAVLITAYLLLEIDVFARPGVRPAENTITTEELPILIGVLCICLLGFAWRLSRQKMLAHQKQETQNRLRAMAFQDQLTGLPNRRSLIDRLHVALTSPPGGSEVHALLMMDLNGFKRINDTHGHAAGDETLTVVGQRLQATVKGVDIVARLGGDEFAILAEHLPSAEAASSLGLRIIESLSAPVVLNRLEQSVGVAIGICVLPFEGATPSEVLRRADLALYKAKAKGKSALRFFDEALDRHLHERSLFEAELRKAIDTHQLEPFFQPIVDLRSKRIVGFEALARWTHPELGEILPERFIPIAEETGLINDLTDQLLRKACEAACSWPVALPLAFNISAVQLHDRTLGLRVLSILGQAGLPPSRLEIEITESALVRDLEAAKDVLGALRDAGVTIALDDFGTGYSSLYHLRNFKLDKIKLDRSFVQNMGSERESAEIIAALIGLGRGLGLTITAEGIEQAGEGAELLIKGCQQGQGFFYGRPLPATDTLRLLRCEMPPCEESGPIMNKSHVR